MSDPTLPPSIAAEFRELRERISAVERGDRSKTYRDRLPTNDATVARENYAGDGVQNIYSAALVNPRYPVFVGRFHLILFGTATVRFSLHAELAGTSRTTQTWTLTGKTLPQPDWAYHVLEIGWKHGIPVDQWQDTETISATRRGNVQVRWEVTASHPWFERGADFRQDLQSWGFTEGQAAVLDVWVPKFRNEYASYAREPEYAFLAPEAAFPTATEAGTLLPGSVIDT